METIFTRIINGEIPAHRIYEDDRVIAFLDIHPIADGHTLVVPKKQIEQFTDLDDKDFLYLMEVSQKLARHLKEVLGKQRVTLRIEGFDVPHVHVHLVPVDTEGESYKADRDQIEPDHAALSALAVRLKSFE